MRKMAFSLPDFLSLVLMDSVRIFNKPNFVNGKCKKYSLLVIGHGVLMKALASQELLAADKAKIFLADCKGRYDVSH